jgi:hypothetical protein
LSQKNAHTFNISNLTPNRRPSPRLSSAPRNNSAPTAFAFKSFPFRQKNVERSGSTKKCGNKKRKKGKVEEGNTKITPCFREMCEGFYYSEHLFHLDAVPKVGGGRKKEISSLFRVSQPHMRRSMTSTTPKHFFH